MTVSAEHAGAVPTSPLEPQAPTAPAEVQLPCDDLAATLDFFLGRLGFRIETIFPADAPRVATISGHGLRLRLAPGDAGAGVIRLPRAALPAGEPRVLIAPNGARIEFVLADPPIELPPLVPAFAVSRAGEGRPPGPGRAGMIYRDLIAGRLGGRFIASHIAIPGGGPVADWVHFHKVRFQMIFCRRGWVRVAYEDQGDPIVMRAGDCVLQPPRIRHRVLEASEGLEVVEIGCPALHETLADHAMTLPTGRTLPDRDFGGQSFLFHVAAEAPWRPEGASGVMRQETGMNLATHGLADVAVLRVWVGGRIDQAAHDRELLFGFLLEGAAVVERAGDRLALGPADAFVIPPGEPWSLREPSPDFSLLQVTVG